MSLVLLKLENKSLAARTAVRALLDRPAVTLAVQTILVVWHKTELSDVRAIYRSSLDTETIDCNPLVIFVGYTHSSVTVLSITRPDTKYLSLRLVGIRVWLTLFKDGFAVGWIVSSVIGWRWR